MNMRGFNLLENFARKNLCVKQLLSCFVAVALQCYQLVISGQVDELSIFRIPLSCHNDDLYHNETP